MIKKSLLVTFDFPPKHGGISSYLHSVCTSLPAESIVVLTEQQETQPTYPFRVYQKKLIANNRLIWPRWLPLVWHMYRLVKKENIQLIQVGQLLPFGTVALLMKLFLKIPYIVYVYGNDMVIMRHSARKMKLIQSILKNAHGVIACSHYTKKLAESTGAHQDTTCVVYPCLTMHQPADANPAQLEKFKETYHLNSKKIILSVGNLVLRKGHDLMLKALPEILRVVPDAIYVICGKGPQLPILEHLVRLHGLEQNVLFVKQLDHHELRLLYQSCDVFIMLSCELHDSSGNITDVEGFGIVFLEANIYGKPVIGGNSGGAPEAIRNGVSGFVVNPTDTHAIAQAVLRLCKDPALAQRIGQQGKERVLSQFVWTKEFQKIKQHLR